MEPQPSNENHFDNIYYSKRKSEPFDGFKWPWNEKKEPKKLREKHYPDARKHWAKTLLSLLKFSMTEIVSSLWDFIDITCFVESILGA